MESKYEGTTCEFNEHMKGVFGDDYLARHIASRLRSSGPKAVIGIAVIGVRTLALFQALQRMLPGSLAVFVDSDSKQRYGRHCRLVNEGAAETPLTKTAFLRRDKLHDSWGLSQIEELCELRLHNNGDPSELIDSFKKAAFEPLGLPLNIFVSPSASLGINCRIYDHVKVEPGVVIEDNVILGHPRPASGKIAFKHLAGMTICRTTIRRATIVRSGTVIYEGVTLERYVDCAHHVVIRENTYVGSRSYITPFTLIKSGVSIGKNCRVGGLIADRVILEDGVTSLGMLVHKYQPRRGGFHEPAPVVRAGGVVGRGAVVIGQVSIGKDSFVGAGTIVTKDVPDGVTIVTPQRGRVTRG